MRLKDIEGPLEGRFFTAENWSKSDKPRAIYKNGKWYYLRQGYSVEDTRELLAGQNNTRTDYYEIDKDYNRTQYILPFSPTNNAMSNRRTTLLDLVNEKIKPKPELPHELNRKAWKRLHQMGKLRVVASFSDRDAWNEIEGIENASFDHKDGEVKFKVLDKDAPLNAKKE